jgi:hypothetical protein
MGSLSQMMEGPKNKFNGMPTIYNFAKVERSPQNLSAMFRSSIFCFSFPLMLPPPELSFCVSWLEADLNLRPKIKKYTD